MRTMKMLFLLLTGFCLTTGMLCKKASEDPEDATLPEKTQSGKQTFGCLVNGEVWLPKGKSMYPGISTTIQFDGLNLITSRGDVTIAFSIPNFKEAGEYLFPITGGIIDYTNDSDVYTCTEGKMTVTTFNKTQKYISGTFWFKAKNENGDMVTIEDGRFDVKYTD